MRRRDSELEHVVELRDIPLRFEGRRYDLRFWELSRQVHPRLLASIPPGNLIHLRSWVGTRGC